MTNNQFQHLANEIIKSLNINIMNYVPQTPKKQSWFSKSNPMFWFVLAVIFSFAGVISLFHINSYFADQHKMNTLFTIGGIVLLAVAAFAFYKASATSTGGKADKLD